MKLTHRFATLTPAKRPQDPNVEEARVADMSETVTTSEEAQMRIRDLKEKARME